MADKQLTMTVDLDVTEKGRELIRAVVVDVLQELFRDTTWLEERVNQVVNQATERAAKRVGLALEEIA